jgi:hypothetical protein
MRGRELSERSPHRQGVLPADRGILGRRAAVGPPIVEVFFTLGRNESITRAGTGWLTLEQVAPKALRHARVGPTGQHRLCAHPILNRAADAVRGKDPELHTAARIESTHRVDQAQIAEADHVVVGEGASERGFKLTHDRSHQQQPRFQVRIMSATGLRSGSGWGLCGR